MTKVKICGLKRKEDIDYINKYLPEYIGLVFAKSRREVSMDYAKELRQALSTDVKVVGVFVNEDIARVARIVADLNLDCIQLHGDESPQYLNEIKKTINSKTEIWKAIRVRDEESINIMGLYKEIDAFVLDTYIEGTYGGIGKVFDWNLAYRAKEYGRIVLAGGLNTENVHKAIKLLSPSVVDTSSSVETEGLKDGEKIKDFINKVRSITEN
ncbi:UNVERIFIED_CONTAM: phosphoribosylanthranilate isomerase [Acetivibrio alkalicellulosi]